MRFRIVAAVLLGALGQAQTKVAAQPKPPPPPQKDDLTSAREATDNFLNGVKIAELPEGQQMLLETQYSGANLRLSTSHWPRPAPWLFLFLIKT